MQVASKRSHQVERARRRRRSQSGARRIRDTIGCFFVLPRVLVETRGSYREFAQWAANVSVGDKRRNLNRNDAAAGVL